MADYGYIGRNPADSNTTIGRQIFTATSGQKTFVVTGKYDVGFIQVYLNGIKLLEGEDYTANDSSSIILDDPCETNDKVEVVVFKAFNVSNPGTVGTLKVTGNLDVAGSLGVVGFLTAAATALDNISITGLSTFGTQNGIGTVTMGKDSAAIFCDGNTRIVGVLTVGEQNTGVTVDGADASVGIGTSVPGAALEIVNTQSRNSFRVSDELNPDYSPFVIDQSGNTGIGTLSPQALFHVRSDNVKILARFRNEDGDEERCEIEFQDEQTSGNFKVKVGSQGDNLTGQCGFQSSIILGDNLNSERVHIRAKVDSASVIADDGLGITGFGTFSDYDSTHEMRDTRIRVAGGIIFRPMTEDHRNGETNMPYIGYGRDGTGEGGNNLELGGTSADGAINFYTGANSNGTFGHASNSQRVVIGPDGQIGIGVTLSDNNAPTTNESVVLGLGVSMCMDNSGSSGDAPVLINAGPGDKSSTSNRCISLGCTAAGASAANNVRIGYALGAPTSSSNSVIIGSRAMCNTNGGVDNVIIGSEINENVTDNSTNGNVVLGHDLEVVNSQDRSVLIGSGMDLATTPATQIDGSNYTHGTGDLSLGYDDKHHIFSQYDGATNLYYNNVNMFATTANGARTSGSLIVDHGLSVSGFATFTGNVSFGTIAGTSADLTLTSNDGGEEILLDQSASQILFKTNNTTRMRFTGTTGTLRSGGATFQFEDSAGNVDFTIAGSGILRSGTTTMQFQDSAGNTDMRIQGAGILRSGTTTFTIQDSSGNNDFKLETDGAITSPRSYAEALGSTRRDLFVRSNGRFGYNSSIRRTKKNIVGLTSESVEWIYDLNPVQFNYRVQDEETKEWTDEAETELEYGLIAEEVEPINVELCDYDPTPDGGQELVTVHYKKLQAPMLRALQDLAGKVKVLEAEVAALKSQLNS